MFGLKGHACSFGLGFFSIKCQKCFDKAFLTANETLRTDASYMSDAEPTFFSF